MKKEGSDVCKPKLCKSLFLRVQAGQFVDESSVIADSLSQTDQIDEWADLPVKPMQLDNEGLTRDADAFDRFILPERLAEWEAGNQKTYTLEEVRQHLAERSALRDTAVK